MNTRNAASKLEECYKLGDVVVYRDFHLDQLHVVDLLFENDPEIVGITGLKKRDSWLRGFARKNNLRHATKAEKKAKRRLDDAV